MEAVEKLWVETVLTRHERENQIDKVVDVQYESAVPKGENYTSLIQRATLDVILGSGRRTKKYAIIKKQLSGKTADILGEFSVFKGEVKIYNEILKAMEVLMEEFQDKKGTLWCQLLGYNPYDTIIFSDLTREGYAVANRKECLDLKHSFLVLKSLGRFHAMSKILMERCLITTQDVNPHYMSRSDSWIVKNFFEGSLKQFSEAITTGWPPEWKEIGERMLNLCDFVCEKLKSLVEYNGEDLFAVVNHGDTWTCNMMFKYSEPEREPIGVKFVDFQVVHINSYACDLLHFIYSSVRPDLRRKHFTELTETYLESLTSTLRFYGYDKKIPNSEDLRKEVERLEFYSFVMLAVIFPITTADCNNALDLEKLDERNAMNAEVLVSPKLINGIGNDLKDFFTRGII